MLIPTNVVPWARLTCKVSTTVGKSPAALPKHNETDDVQVAHLRSVRRWNTGLGFLAVGEVSRAEQSNSERLAAESLAGSGPSGFAQWPGGFGAYLTGAGFECRRS